MGNDTQLEKLKTRLTLADFKLSPKAKKLIQDKIDKEKKDAEKILKEKAEKKLAEEKRLEEFRKLEETTKQISENTHIEEIKELETDKIKEELGTSEEKLENDEISWIWDTKDSTSEEIKNPVFRLKEQTKAKKKELESLQKEAKRLEQKVKYDENFKYKNKTLKINDWKNMNEFWAKYTLIYETLKTQNIDDEDFEDFKKRYEKVKNSDYQTILTEQPDNIPDGLIYKARWGDIIDWRKVKFSQSLFTLNIKLTRRYPNLFETTK